MKRKIKHVRANHDEYVHVHRPAPLVSPSGGWEQLAPTVGKWVAGVCLVLWVLNLLLPYLPWLILGAICWGALQVLGKK